MDSKMSKEKQEEGTSDDEVTKLTVIPISNDPQNNDVSKSGISYRLKPCREIFEDLLQRKHRTLAVIGITCVLVLIGIVVFVVLHKTHGNYKVTKY